MAGIIAYVLVRTRVGAEHFIANQIKGLPGVTEVVVTYGTYDLVVRIEADSFESLDRVVTRIRGLPEVIETVTLVGTPS